MSLRQSSRLHKRMAEERGDNAAISPLELGLGEGRGGKQFHLVVLTVDTGVGDCEANTDCYRDHAVLVQELAFLNRKPDTFAQRLAPLEICFGSNNQEFL